MQNVLLYVHTFTCVVMLLATLLTRLLVCGSLMMLLYKARTCLNGPSVYELHVSDTNTYLTCILSAFIWKQYWGLDTGCIHFGCVSRLAKIERGEKACDVSLNEFSKFVQRHMPAIVQSSSTTMIATMTMKDDPQRHDNHRGDGDDHVKMTMKTTTTITFFSSVSNIGRHKKVI